MKNVSASTIMLTSVRWNEMFDNEEELVSCLKSIDVDKYISNCYKGYQYVRSFQNQLNNGGELSPKQVTQLKRIAKEIYRYIKNY